MSGELLIGLCVAGYLGFLVLVWAMMRSGAKEDAARREWSGR